MSRALAPLSRAHCPVAQMPTAKCLINPGERPKQSRPASSRPGGNRLPSRYANASGGLDFGLLGGDSTSLGALGEHLGDALDGTPLVELLDRGDLACHAVQRRLVQLALGVGLLGLALRPVEIAHHLSDGDEVTRVDFRLVLLRAAAPHGALDPRPSLEGLHGAPDYAFLGELAHADAGRLAGR